jgi:hypothetical protein
MVDAHGVSHGTRLPSETPLAAEERLIGEGNYTAASMVLILARLEADLEEAGWDEPPRLFTVQRQLAPPELLPATGLDGFLLALEQFGPHLGGMDGPGMARAIESLAGLIKDGFPAPAELLGWVLVHEAWLITTTDPNEFGEVAEAAGQHRINQHPKRVEIRMVVAVDRSGTAYQLMRQRGAEPELLIDDGRNYQLLGDLPAALKVLLDATP